MGSEWFQGKIFDFDGGALLKEINGDKESSLSLAFYDDPLLAGECARADADGVARLKHFFDRDGLIGRDQVADAAQSRRFQERILRFDCRIDSHRARETTSGRQRRRTLDRGRRR